MKYNDDLDNALYLHINAIARDVIRVSRRVPDFTAQENVEAVVGTGVSQALEEGLAIGLLAPEVAERLLEHMHVVIHARHPSYTKQDILEGAKDLLDAVGRSGKPS